MNRPTRLLAFVIVAATIGGCAVPDMGESLSPSGSLPVPTATEQQPTTEPTPELTASPEPSPKPDVALWHENSIFAAYGAIGTVLVDRLRVRIGAGLDLPLAHSWDDSVPILEAGDQVLLVSGPMEADGYRWYSVEFEGDDKTSVLGGWVAGAKASPGQEPAADDWMIDISPPSCPQEIGLAQIRVMTGWAVDACRAEVTRIRGMIDSCYEGSMSPWKKSPEWAWFTCSYIRDESVDPFSSRWYPIYFPPDYDGPPLERGDVVVLTGQLGVDASRYGPCTLDANDPNEPSLALQLPTARFSFIDSCRHLFVVSGATKKRHVELEPLF